MNDDSANSWKMNRFFYLGIAGGIAGILLVIVGHLLPAMPAVSAPIPQRGNRWRYPATISTTLNDFFLPGTQPGGLEHGIFAPSECTLCHRGYSGNPQTNTAKEHEIWTAWQGSMMALAGRDPLFWAALDIANADAANAGEFCLRCHAPKAWLSGRSSPPDGSGLLAEDFEGIECELCHRLVDPVYSAENPSRDLTVLAGLTTTIPFPASAMMVFDPQDQRRGPFQLEDDWAFNPHSGVAAVPDYPLKSPYHQEAALCGTCHDILNPLFSWDAMSGSYQPNALDTPGTITDSFPIETTYSEWLLSDYNSPTGVYAPQFGGNKKYVSTCQDCHMRDVTAAGADYFGTHVIRDDMPWHDLTGANSWVPQTVLAHPEFGDDFDAVQIDAINAGIDRARTMLQSAASVGVAQVDNTITVTVVNETGHKLPTGYPEGRRMWLQVEGYDENGALIYSSGAYDATTAELTMDGDLKLYQAELGLTPDWATQTGMPAGASFHFAMNNAVISDNRIPPRGFVFADFEAAGAAPVSNGMADSGLYADGQYWDTTVYQMPAGVKYGYVRLAHQIASKEYIEFLRDNNPFPADPNNRGQILYDLWEQTGRSAPETMAEIYFGPQIFLPLIRNEENN